MATNSIQRDRITKSRVKMLLHHPFFGNLATRLKVVDASDRLSTAATDGRHFYYNEDFVSKLTDGELVFLMAHECMHCVFEHMLRKGDRDAALWNMAGDYVINNMLDNERIGDIIKLVPILLDHKYDKMTTEEVYDKLIKDSVKIQLPLDVHLDMTKDGDPEDGENSGGNGIAQKLSDEERKALQDELKDAILQAAQSAGAGNVPAGIERFIKDFTEPKMAWQDLCRIQLTSMIKNDYSFTRPSRKSWHTGAVLPGMLPAEEVDVCIAIDTSGSISHTMCKDFLSEIQGIMGAFDSWKIKVWTFDTAVYGEQDFSSDGGDDISTYVIQGGGGTTFEANWEYMSEHDIQPKQLIFFTDGLPCGGWCPKGMEDYCDTLFVIHGAPHIEAPFGTTAHYTE
jgi:predicted metal-dependent peptidase